MLSPVDETQDQSEFLPAYSPSNQMMLCCSNLLSISFLALVLSSAILTSAESPANGRSYRPDDIVVDGGKLFVDGKEFFFKGIAYNPVPLGYRSVDQDGWNGGGFCSTKKNAWSEFKSACFDSDFFDGSDGGLDRQPPGPVSWFKEVWDRDFPIMKTLGVNVLRLYNANPTTLLATQQLLSQGWNGIKEARGKDHRPFMDAAHAAGFKVMFPLLSDESLLNDTDAMASQKIKNLIDEVGNHPALVMWVFGNELDFASPRNLQLRAQLNSKMQFIRNYTLAKWNRVVPVTSCVIDIPSIYDSLAATLEVDVFCPNAGYRGGSLTDLFTGNVSQRFSGFAKLSRHHSKPVLIGEMGFLSVNNSINKLQPTWFNRLWKDVLDNSKDGSIGGVLFEYSDEIYKRNAPPDQTHLGVVSLSPSKDPVTGGSSLDENAFVPDIVTEKPVIFAAVRNGTLAGQPINFNTDTWKYLNRVPAVLRQNSPSTQSPSSQVSSMFYFCFLSFVITVVAMLCS